MGYFKDTVKGISWMGGLRGVTRIITLARLAVLARILTPAQFGVFGIATLALSFVEILTETGINIFLIQQEGEINKYLNTAWIISIIRGILISLAIIVVSPLIVLFFKSPDSYILLLLISIVPFIRGFINPSVVKFQKDLQFHRDFYFRSSLFFVDSLVVVSLALLTREASSFIFGLIVSGILEVILSFIMVKPVPRIQFNLNIAKEIIQHGKWVTGAGVFNYLFSNSDNIVIGRLLGTGPLGLYQTGYRISTLPITEISDVVSKVVFPVYVKIAGDITRLKRAFLKTTFIISSFSVIFGLILFFFTHELISFVLGPIWLEVVPTVKVLAIFGIIRTISGSPASLFLAVKKQKYVTIATFISFLGLAVSIVPLVSKFGMTGAGISALIGSLLALPFFSYFAWSIFRKKIKS